MQEQFIADDAQQTKQLKKLPTAADKGAIIMDDIDFQRVSYFFQPSYKHFKQ